MIKNYHSLSVLLTPKPETHSAIQVSNPQGYLFTHIIRMQGDHEVALKAICKTCRAVSKDLIGIPKEMEIYYMEDYLKNELTGERKTMMLVLCFMVIAVLISAFGLLAMSISYTEQQSKRVALSKVKGSSTLDSKNSLEVMQLLSHLNVEGTTIVMVTHSQHDAAYAHRIVNLFDGQVIDDLHEEL